MIVATAGHIDHGKTLLVRTLTGIDTDRLPEEKARGISIDLGFAHAAIAGEVVSFVDVPGHERFIRSMLAGVCGIDAALLVVAADDGVMPQSVEHVHILDLLGVERGLAVVTKCDRVPPERVEAVRSEVAGLLASTRLAGCPVLPVSAVTGAGLDALRGGLAALSAAARRALPAGQHFRLAIDRAFGVAGSGTVVTGTVFNGRVAPGDKLVISPRGAEVRVRGVQVHGRPVEAAVAAQRCALALAGAELAHVARGDWLVHPALHAPTRRLDVRLALLPAKAQPLAHWTPVHVHLATVHVPARIAMSRGESLAPGGSAHVQLVLDRAIGALRGDRFVIRDASARRTLGGGVVLDPFAPARRRAAAARAAQLAALEQQSPEDTLRALLDASPAGVDLARFARTLGLTAERAEAARSAVGAAMLAREPAWCVSAAMHARAQSALVDALRAFHAAQPKAPGMEAAALHRVAAPHLPAPAFQAMLRGLAIRQALVLTNDVARLPSHDPTANPADAALWERVRRALPAAATAPTVAELAAALAVKEPVLRDFLHRKSRGGDVVRVGTERFYTRATLASLAATAAAIARASPGGLFGAAQFRDAIGCGRGLAIQILETLDRLGITQRIGDNRRVARDFEPLLGPAAPLEASGAARA